MIIMAIFVPIKRYKVKLAKNRLYIIMKPHTLDDYTRLSVIGKGTYAKVLLVRGKDDKQVYAMKVLKKKYIL